MDGFRFKVVAGTKLRRHDGAPGHDLRLECWNPEESRWVPVKMELGAVLADFFYENEEHLFRRDEGFAGGRKYTYFINSAMTSGWLQAARTLNRERKARDDRRGEAA